MANSSMTLDMGNAAEKLIDKISSAIGILYDPYGTKAAYRSYSKLIADKIVNDDELTLCERDIFMNELRLSGIKHKNRSRIISIAMNYLEKGISPEKIADSWVLLFFEKAGNICDDDFQHIWGKVLASEANNPNSISRRLLHNLYLMNSNDAENFLNLSSFCFLDQDSDLSHPVVFIREHFQDYNKSKITTEVLKELEHFSLIETNYETGFMFKNKKRLMYTNNYIELRAPFIPSGNVRLTSDGQKLMSLVEKRNDESILEYTLQKWQYSNIDVRI